MLKGVDGMAWVDLTPDGDSIWYNDDAPADYDVDFNKAVRLLNQLRYNLVLVDLGELLGMNGWTHVVAIGLKNGEYYNFQCGEDWISVNGFLPALPPAPAMRLIQRLVSGLLYGEDQFL